jgi:hypothetical protein
MRKTLVSLAALAAVGLVAPYVAPAQADETVVIKRHHERDHYWNYAPRHDKTVIIKHRHEHRHEHHDEY